MLASNITVAVTPAPGKLQFADYSDRSHSRQIGLLAAFAILVDHQAGNCRPHIARRTDHAGRWMTALRRVESGHTFEPLFMIPGRDGLPMRVSSNSQEMPC